MKCAENSEMQSTLAGYIHIGSVSKGLNYQCFPSLGSKLQAAFADSLDRINQRHIERMQLFIRLCSH